MGCSDSGKARVKMILSLGFLAIMIYVTVKTLPVYVHNYELKDYLRELTIQATAGQRPNVDTIRSNVLAKAQELDLPVKPTDVKIDFTGGRIVINLDYVVPVDLQIYTWNLHFTPSADNRALT